MNEVQINKQNVNKQNRDEISPRIGEIPPISNFDLCTKV